MRERTDRAALPVAAPVTPDRILTTYTYSVVLPHRDGERVWAPNGVVPQLRLADSWPPGSIEAIAAAMHDSYDIEVRCVRHVPCDDAIVVEVESDDPPSEGWLASADDVAAAAWRSTRSAPNRAPWERPGWFATAATTFLEALEEVGVQAAGAPKAIKGAWPCSAVLLTDTTAGRYFFKAGSQKPPREPATLRQLRETGVTCVPEVVATGTDDDWMITVDFGARPVTDHASALRAFAQLQLSVGDSLEGLPDFAPLTIARQLPDIAGVARAAEELAASPIPPMLVLQDLRAGNVAAARTGFTFFDWTDAVRSHPFFSGIRYLDLFGQVDESCKWNDLHDLTEAPPLFIDLRDAYLEPFADVVGMDAARRDFDLAWAFQGAFMAVRWDWEQSHLERDAPWSSWLRTFAKNEQRIRVPARLGD